MLENLNTNISIKKIDRDDEIKELLHFGLALVNDNKISEVNQFIESIFRNTTLLGKLKTKHWEYLASISLFAGKFNLTKACFVRSNNLESCAFVSILTGDYNEAKVILLNCVKSPVTSWCNYLISLHENKLSLRFHPSFLQVRNFLELTVQGLLRSGNSDLLHKIENNIDLLLDINLDAYKLIGISYYLFGDINSAKEILTQCLDLNRYDGELYYHLSKVYTDLGDYETAYKMIKNARVMMPNHYASKLQESHCLEVISNI